MWFCSQHPLQHRVGDQRQPGHQRSRLQDRDTIVSFAAGVTTVEVIVKIVGDNKNESNESFRAVLANNNDTTGDLVIIRNVALGTIIDDD